MPSITDWLMVVITAVYVIATILICVANMKSAKATREQIEESKRQFEEINRPRIVVEFIYEKRSFYGLRFVNEGHNIANNVRIALQEDFVNSLKEANIKSLLEDQKNKMCVIGVGQHYDLFFGTNRYRDTPDKVPASGTVTYEGNGREYTDYFYIDLNEYATIFSINSEQEDMQKILKNQTQELSRIRQAIQQLKVKEDKETTNV